MEDPFNQLLDKMRELHAAKAKDYSGEDDPYLNFRYCEQMGVRSWKGVVVRISDKFSRLMTLAKKEWTAIKTESLEDTLLDLAAYCLICIILYREVQPLPSLKNGPKE